MNLCPLAEAVVIRLPFRYDIQASVEVAHLLWHILQHRPGSVGGSNATQARFSRQ
jgi:hypothetical protein